MFEQRGIDCPACGVAAWTGLCQFTSDEPDEWAACSVCALSIWQGTILDRGVDLSEDAVNTIVRLRFGSGELRGPAYVAPEDRTGGIRFRGAAPDVSDDDWFPDETPIEYEGSTIDFDAAPEPADPGGPLARISSVTIRFRRERRRAA
jgi:hypothetical protein